MSVDQIQAAIDRQPVRPVQIQVLLICFLLNMLDGYDVLSMAFAAPPLAQDWSLSPQRLGIVFSAGVLGMTLGAMFLAPLTDRIGRRSMVLYAVTGMGVSMLATAYVNNLAALVTLRILTGLGIGAMLASLTSMVSEFFPDRHRNLAVGINLAGYPLGATIGGFIAAQLIPHFGWQGVFIFGGIATLAVLPLCWFLLPESVHYLLCRRPKQALDRANRVLERLEIPTLEQLPELEVEPATPNVQALLGPAHRELTLQLWTGFFLTFGTLYFLLSWIPKLLVDAGLPLDQAIYASVAFNLGGAAGNVGIGWVSGRWGLQRSVLLFSCTAALALVVMALLPLAVAVLLVIAAILGFFQQGGLVGFYAMAARVYPAEIRTTGIGWSIGLGRFGAVIGPYLGGVLIAVGWSMGSLFIFFAVPLVFAGMVAYRLRLTQD